MIQKPECLRLSDSVYGSNSVAAIGVAAHECGHAIQDQEDYVPLRFRSAFVPVAIWEHRLLSLSFFWVYFWGSLWSPWQFFPGAVQRQSQKPDPGSGKYLIYYLNSSLTKLVAQEYETETKDQADLAEELMDQLLHVPRDLDCQPAVNEKVSFKTCRIDEQVLYLYFDGSYISMKPEQEILCRAALARTMTQIPGIDYISIYRGDQLLWTVREILWALSQQEISLSIQVM